MEGKFKQALPVLEKLIEAGFEAYFVGGSVRDALLGLEVNDVDIATSAYPKEVKQVFDKTIDVGIEHGTVMVLFNGESYEVTTFRTESTYQDYRRPDSVTFVRSLEEDLKRRDFTINALAADETGEIKDFFDGEKDLENGLIRAVGKAQERFNEDALRMMRGVRFAAQLDFDIEEQTLKAIKKHAHLLGKIAVERIQVEFVKLLLSKSRSKGIEATINTELYRHCPEISDDKQALKKLITPKRISNERQAWALLLYYKEATFINSFLRSWKTSNKMIQEVTILLQTLKKRVRSSQIDLFTLYKIGLEMALDVESLLEHLGETSQPKRIKEKYEQLPIHSKRELKISGHDLIQLTDASPGKWLGNTMDAVERAVVLEELKNDKEEILKWVKEKDYIPH